MRLEGEAIATGECLGERMEDAGEGARAGGEVERSRRGQQYSCMRACLAGPGRRREHGLQSPDYAGCQAGWGWCVYCRNTGISQENPLKPQEGTGILVWS